MSIKVSKFKISRILERLRSDENQSVDMWAEGVIFSGILVIPFTFNCS